MEKLPLDINGPGSPGSPGPHVAETGALEDALRALDERLASLGQDAASLTKRLKEVQESSKLGDLSQLAARLDAVRAAARSLADNARHLQWTFPNDQRISDGSYVHELAAAARDAGLSGVRIVNGEVFAFPNIVRVDKANPSALLIGKRRLRAMRPSYVAAVLVRARSRFRSVPDKELLQAVEKAYLIRTGGNGGVAIPLAEIYELLTLRPGQAREFELVEFLLAIYTLDKTGPHRTRAGRTISFPASTATRGGKGFQFVTEAGEEKLYSGVRFDG